MEFQCVVRKVWFVSYAIKAKEQTPTIKWTHCKFLREGAPKCSYATDGAILTQLHSSLHNRHHILFTLILSTVDKSVRLLGHISYTICRIQGAFFPQYQWTSLGTDILIYSHYTIYRIFSNKINVIIFPC